MVSSSARLSLTLVAALCALVTPALSSIVFSEGSLPLLREESWTSFWSATCAARGVPVDQPTAAAVTFYICLLAVLVVALGYATRTCARMLHTSPAGRRV
nr:gN [Suid alphaherpesvirus 1]